MAPKDLIVMGFAFLTILLLMAARHHPPPGRQINDVQHGHISWDSNSTMLRSSSKVTPEEDTVTPIIIVANSCVMSTKLGNVLRELLLAHNVSLHPTLKQYMWDWEIYTEKAEGLLHTFKQTLNGSTKAYKMQHVMQAFPRGIFKMDSGSFHNWKISFPETHKNARIVKVERRNKLLKHICHYSDCFTWYFPQNVYEIASNVFENGAPSEMCWKRRTSKSKQYLQIKDMDKFESVFKQKELARPFQHDFVSEDLLSFYSSKDNLNLSLNRWAELFSMLKVAFDKEVARTFMNKHVETYRPSTVQSKLTPESFYEISKRPLFQKYLVKS